MTDLSVIQYNPYNMYQNFGYYYPSFNGAYTQQYQNIPLYDFNALNYNYKPDTITFSANNQVQAETKKQGISTGAKVAIGAGIVTALAVGADFVFCKGRHVKNLLGKLKGNNSNTPTSPPTTNPPAPPKKPNFFEQKGLKVNKGIVSNADGTLYTGALEKVNKNGEKFVLKYKDGILQASEKYTKTGDYVSCKKYTQVIETGYDRNKIPYSIKKRYMLEYNKDGKIVNGTLVYEGKDFTYFNNNKYSVHKNNKEIIKTRYAKQDGTEVNLFEQPFEKESDAKFALGSAGLKAVGSPLNTHYPVV